MSTDEEIIDKASAHPMEDLFDIESETTNVPTVQRTTQMATSVDHPYDDKDNEIDEQFQEIYDTALEAYGAQSQEAELVEGKYKARNQEIAVQFLNTALAAAANKGTLKNNKEKLALAALKISQSAREGGPNKDGLVTGDRNAILRALREQRAAATEDGKFTEVDD